MQKQHEHNLSNQADECRLRIAQRVSILSSRTNAYPYTSAHVAHSLAFTTVFIC